MVEVVQLEPGDERRAQQWAQTVMTSVPFVLSTAEYVLGEADHVPHALAVDGDDVLGVARVRDETAHDGSVGALLAVLRRERGRGAGSALLRWTLDRAREYGATRVVGAAEESEELPAQMLRWGFELGGRSRMSWIDPQGVGPPAELGDRLPEDLTLLPLHDVEPRTVWECHQAAAPDDPSGFSRPMPFEHYVDEELHDPLLRHDLSHTVLDGDGRCVAFSLLRVAGRRGWSSMTAVHPDQRRRGLSLAVKAATLRAAARDGLTRCGTGNAAENAPVLALNARLGYQLMCTVRRLERSLERGGGPAAPSAR